MHTILVHLDIEVAAELEPQLSKIEGLAFRTVTKQSIKGDLATAAIIISLGRLIIPALRDLLLKIVDKNTISYARIGNKEFKNISAIELETLLKVLEKTVDENENDTK